MSDLEDKLICLNCVRENYLTGVTETQGSDGKCSYCGDTELTLPLGEIAKLVERGLLDHYERMPSEPNSFEYTLSNDPEHPYEWHPKGWPIKGIIFDAAEVDQNVADEIQKILAQRNYDCDRASCGLECEFESESNYEEVDPHSHVLLDEWENFVERLSHRARYFDRNASAFLERVFGNLNHLRTSAGSSVLVKGGPRTRMKELSRGRVFQRHDAMLRALERPDRDLGTPPSEFAMPGRMNPRGISLFYGATDPKVALAEIRPPVGSFVALAKFKIIRPVLLLDLDALAKIEIKGSIFDPSYTESLRRAGFLRDLVQKLAEPVQPDDADLAYLPTQVVADFLANWVEPRLDGIIYKSVQSSRSGRNVALFNHAALVEELDLPEGLEIEARLDQLSDDGDFGYRVWETLPKRSGETETSKDEPLFDRFDFGDNVGNISLAQSREPTLRIDLGSIQVCHVKAVRVEVETNDVERDRFDPNDEAAF